MSRRTHILIAAFLFSALAHAQVQFSEGEVLLRGTLISTEGAYHLVVNPETRSMSVLDLTPTKDVKFISQYKSGTKVEACVAVEKQTELTLNRAAQLTKIRPLSPSEAVIIYPSQMPVCTKGKGCVKFGEKLKGIAFASALAAQGLPKDYFRCRK